MGQRAASMGACGASYLRTLVAKRQHQRRLSLLSDGIDICASSQERREQLGVGDFGKAQYAEFSS